MKTFYSTLLEPFYQYEMPVGK